MEGALIEAVQKRRPLWSPDDAYYKNVPIIRSLWKEVAREVNEDEKTLRAKWKNLRTYFFRELRKMEKRDEESKDAISSWHYLDRLMFLSDAVPGGKCFQDVTQEDSVMFSHDDSQLEISHASSPIVISNPTSAKEVPRPRKKMKSMLSLMAQREDKILELRKKKLEILDRESTKDLDDDWLFLQSLLPFMKKLAGARKLRLRSKIQDLIVTQLEDMKEEPADDC